ncbi:MAG TPA: PASTA domain-containing protein [Chitinophagaceae bacterium]|nr:PASTA domain-containing protein [Chitinophagaceae bacterium]
MLIGLLYTFFNSLNWLTNHGQETKVPKLEGKNMKEAIKTLESQGFHIQIDSTFISYKKPLEVLYQEPEVGAIVKIGRTIFLTVNRQKPPTIKMPNLVGLSFRNALLVMQSYRLVMGDTLYRPDVAAGAILDQLYKGRTIAAGDPIPFGSIVSLVVGEGLKDEVDVPNLIGLRWIEAQKILSDLQLTANIMWEGAITDSMNAIVFMQDPEAINELDFVNRILKGDLIDLRIMQNPSPDLIQKNQPGSKKLLGEIENEEMTDSIANATSPKVKMNRIDSNKTKTQIQNKNEVIGTVKIPKSENEVSKPHKKKSEDNSPLKHSDNKIGNEYE